MRSDTEETDYRVLPRPAPNSMDGDIKGTGRLLGNQVYSQMKLK